MVYSIKTKDGITISNIPDDVAPDSDVLKQRVAAIRAGGQEDRVANDSSAGGADLSSMTFNPFGIDTGIDMPDSLSAGLVGAGRGLTKIGRGLGLVDPEPEMEKQRFEELKNEYPISTTAGEIAGESAPFLIPGLGQGAAVAKLGGGLAVRAGTTGLLGALEAALITRGEGRSGKDQLTSAGIGGTVASAMELALPYVGRAGGRIVRKMTGKAPKGAVINPVTGQPSQEFLDALNIEGLTFDDIASDAAEQIAGKNIDPAQAARKAFFESQGLKPTKAQITRNAADFQIQEEAAKTTGRVRDALEAQDAVLTSRFNNEILKSGGNANSEASSVVDSLTEKATVLDQQISDLYDFARQSAGRDKNIKLESLSSKLKALAPANRRTGGAIETIVGDLKQKGVLNDDFKIVGRIDVETAEDVRKLANELYDPQNPFANSKLRELKDALDDDVFKTQGADVFKQARKAKTDFERELSRAKVSKFDTRKSNIVRDILENKIDPDKMVDQTVFSKKWRSDDLQQLKDYITTNESGKSAFDDLRAETLQAIKDKSLIGPIDDKGFQRLSRDKLQKAIQSIGSKKMKVLFKPDEQRFLADVLKVTQMREPVRSTALGKGPSAQAIASLEQKLKDIPLLGSVINILNVDATGRLAVKASPKKLIEKASGSPLITAAALSSSAAAQTEE